LKNKCEEGPTAQDLGIPDSQNTIGICLYAAGDCVPRCEGRNPYGFPDPLLITAVVGIRVDLRMINIERGTEKQKEAAVKGSESRDEKRNVSLRCRESWLCFIITQSKSKQFQAEWRMIQSSEKD